MGGAGIAGLPWDLQTLALHAACQKEIHKRVKRFQHGATQCYELRGKVTPPRVRLLVLKHMLLLHVARDTTDTNHGLMASILVGIPNRAPPEACVMLPRNVTSTVHSKVVVPADTYNGRIARFCGPNGLHTCCSCSCSCSTEGTRST